MSDMLDAKLRVSVIGSDELLSLFKKSETGVKGMRSAVKRELEATGQDITRFASSAARSLGTLGGLGASIGIAAQAKNVLELRDAIAGLASTAGLGEDSLEGLRLQILSTSKATNQLGGDLAEALQAFVAKTGDIETGRKNLELYGKTATAARASVSDIANIGAELPKLGIKGDQSQALAILAKQSDVGAVELKDLVKEGPRLLSAFAAGGLQGEHGLRQGGAFAQMAMKGTGSVDIATSAVEAAFRDVAQRSDQLQAAGISVFDPKTGKARDRVDVIKDIITKSGGLDQNLILHNRRGVFDAEGMRAIQPLTEEYRRTGGFGTLESFANVQADSSLIDKKYNLNAGTGLGRIKAAQIDIQNSTDKHFGDLLDSVVKNHAGDISGALDFTMSHPLLVGGGLMAARSGFRMLGAWGKGGGGIGGVAGGALSALTGGQGSPVYVTNWPGGGLGGGGGVLGLAEAATKATGALGIFKLAAANAQGVLASFGVGFAIGTWLDNKYGLSDKLSGTSKGAINKADNEEMETPEVRNQRELDVAKNIAKQMKAGKLTPEKAALQLLGSEHNIEHVKSGTEASRYGQWLVDQLYHGNSDTVLRQGGVYGGLGNFKTAPEIPMLEYSQAPASKGIPASLAATDWTEALAKGFQPQFTINIDAQGGVDVKSDDGTQSPRVQVRRSTGAL